MITVYILYSWFQIMLSRSVMYGYETFSFQRCNVTSKGMCTQHRKIPCCRGGVCLMRVSRVVHKIPQNIRPLEWIFLWAEPPHLWTLLPHELYRFHRTDTGTAVIPWSRISLHCYCILISWVWEKDKLEDYGSKWFKQSVIYFHGVNQIW